MRREPLSALCAFVVACALLASSVTAQYPVNEAIPVYGNFTEHEPEPLFVYESWRNDSDIGIFVYYTDSELWQLDVSSEALPEKNATVAPGGVLFVPWTEAQFASTYNLTPKRTHTNETPALSFSFEVFEASPCPMWTECAGELINAGDPTVYHRLDDVPADKKLAIRFVTPPWAGVCLWLGDDTEAGHMPTPDTALGALFLSFVIFLFTLACPGAQTTFATRVA